MPRPCGQKMVSSDSSWVWAALRSPGSGHRRRCGPLDGDGNLVGGDDVAAQARATLENIGAILEAAGATFADVLKVIVYLTDIGDRAAINPVRQEFFGDSRPCSTLIGINELVVPGMKVEIEAIAGISS